MAKKRTRQPLAEDAGPKSKKAKKKPNTVTYIKMESPEEYTRNIRLRIDEVLKIASAGGELITYEKYEKAVVEQPRKGSEVLLRRDIDEIFVNNYNAEWIVSWDANIDISPVYDYYGTITYITDYFTKVGTINQCLAIFNLRTIIDHFFSGQHWSDGSAENCSEAARRGHGYEAEVSRDGQQVHDASTSR